MSWRGIAASPPSAAILAPSFPAKLLSGAQVEERGETRTLSHVVTRGGSLDRSPGCPRSPGPG